MARIKKLRKQDYNIVRGRTDELGCSIDLLFLEGHKTIQSSTSSAQALPDAKASVNKKDLARLRTRGSFTRPRTSANSSGIAASHGIDSSEYKKVFLRDGLTTKKEPLQPRCLNLDVVGVDQTANSSCLLRTPGGEV